MIRLIFSRFKIKNYNMTEKTQLKTLLIQQIYSRNIQSIFYVKVANLTAE